MSEIPDLSELSLLQIEELQQADSNFILNPDEETITISKDVFDCICEETKKLQSRVEVLEKVRYAAIKALRLKGGGNSTFQLQDALKECDGSYKEMRGKR